MAGEKSLREAYDEGHEAGDALSLTGNQGPAPYVESDEELAATTEWLATTLGNGDPTGLNMTRIAEIIGAVHAANPYPVEQPSTREQ